MLLNESVTAIQSFSSSAEGIKGITPKIPSMASKIEARLNRDEEVLLAHNKAEGTSESIDLHDTGKQLWERGWTYHRILLACGELGDSFMSTDSFCMEYAPSFLLNAHTEFVLQGDRSLAHGDPVRASIKSLSSVLHEVVDRQTMEMLTAGNIADAVSNLAMTSPNECGIGIMSVLDKAVVLQSQSMISSKILASVFEEFDAHSGDIVGFWTKVVSV